MDYSLAQLQAFVSTVEHGSFKDASIELNKRPQVIAKLVAALEDSCDQLLFVRHVRQLKITTEGKTLYRLARRVILDAQAFERQLSAMDQNQPSEFKLAIDTSLACPMVSGCYLAVLEEFPSINLEVLSGGTSQVIEWVRRGQAEMGLIFSPLTEEQGLTQITVYNFSVVEVASPQLINHGAVVDEHQLAQLPQLVPKFVYEYKHDNIYVFSDKTIVSNNVEESIRIMLSGKAWCRLPGYIVQPYLDNQQLHEFSIEGANRVVWHASIVHPEQAELSLASDIFMERVQMLPDRIS
ncbi:LysR family transcriptional regulator [Alginatibacterium sediminis]|uniref:LysR family transcriptional regulator n=1 Tax=Alginatibacterium sediminis TaxID=2164068 RepID=A0A420E8G2_9ALTE|nr:LysR family transcriptional regulator [Alginatibacterium sediminis]RKF15691.1 LysR family transcriptional regulator [Alginatibacterium sediminis]